MKINLKTTSLLIRLNNCKKNNYKKNNYKKNNYKKIFELQFIASIFIIILSYFSEIENQIVFKSANIFYTKMIRLD